jgi:predicted adenylyl cyclase CyaB
LTFKGPRLKGIFKRRVEIETPVNWEKTRALLLAAGFRKVAGYSKTREEYALGKTHVTIDHLTKNGWFMEIEGKPSEISKYEKTLGLSKKQREHRTYLEIKMRHPERSEGSR